MKISKISSICLMISVLIVFGACAQSPVPPPARPQSAPAAGAASAQQPWEKDWEKVKQEARNEGKLVMYSAVGATVRTTLIDVFKEQYDVDLEILISREAERLARLLKERGAGIYAVDLWVGGAGAATETLAPQGILEPLDKFIILPEALDKKAWHTGDLLWVDQGHYQLTTLASPKVPLAINTDLVKQGEITSYTDLLNPRWKGKIVMEDPSSVGSGNAWFTVAVGLLGQDYFRKFAQQEPFISREPRLLTEWVAKGKYAIGLAVNGAEIVQFKKAGAPLALVTPKEGTHVTGGGSGSVSFIDKAPHPNAAKLFINWFLTKEGGAILSRASEYQSGRVDVPTDFLEPENLRQPGIKYINVDTQEYARKRGEMAIVAREIFGIR
ncbi:MAG: extracellular solute-binding protein [Chloroflexi bacterium]|nr:extracellular solute-binding protein [Chloroflexota bacterium]